MAAALVILNAYPGVGKQSIAKELSVIFPNVKVVDLHHLDVVANSMHPSGSSTNEAFRVDMRKNMLASLPTTNNASPTSPVPPTLYILTDTILSTSSGLSTLRAFLASGLPIIHILLSCSTSTNITRLTTDTLSRRARGKLIDEGQLLELRMEDELARLINPQVMRERGGKIEGLAGEHEIETTRMDKRAAAGVVAEYVMDDLRRAGVFVTMQRRKSLPEARM